MTCASPVTLIRSSTVTVPSTTYQPPGSSVVAAVTGVYCPCRFSAIVPFTWSRYGTRVSIYGSVIALTQKFRPLSLMSLNVVK